MPRGFDFWFGGIDLNQPAYQGFTAGRNDNEAGTSAGHPTWQHSDETHPTWQHPDETDTSRAYSFGQSGDATGAPIDTMERVSNNGSGFHIGVTLSSEDSGDEGEVQSTPEGHEIPQDWHEI